MIIKVKLNQALVEGNSATQIPQQKSFWFCHELILLGLSWERPTPSNWTPLHSLKLFSPRTTTKIIFFFFFFVLCLAADPRLEVKTTCPPQPTLTLVSFPPACLCFCTGSRSGIRSKNHYFLIYIHDHCTLNSNHVLPSKIQGNIESLR